VSKRKYGRREMRFRLQKLEQLIGDIITVNKLHLPGIPDIVQGIEPIPTPFAVADPTLTREYRPGEKAAYEKGYTNGWDARERTQGGDWPKATVSQPVRLPDGSGFCTASFPLPKDHWLYKKDAEGFQPRMPKHLKLPLNSREVYEVALTEALKVAVRAATGGGRDEDFDPDALLLNFFSALFSPEAD
jgi:hypothetical protein